MSLFPHVITMHSMPHDREVCTVPKYVHHLAKLIFRVLGSSRDIETENGISAHLQECVGLLHKCIF